jgi:hypothetical protein
MRANLGFICGLGAIGILGLHFRPGASFVEVFGVVAAWGALWLSFAVGPK